MSGKIITYLVGILSVVCVILILVLSYTFRRIDTLKTEKNELKNDLLKKELFIKEMEKVNELYMEASKENEKFKQELANDHTDNLDVRPAGYILERLHED